MFPGNLPQCECFVLPLVLFAAISVAPDALRCATRQDRIEISLPGGMDKRIGSLAVVHGRRWLTLVDEAHHFAAFRPGVRRLVLEPSWQMGVYWAADGTERRVKVFAGPGAYRIVFADNLETEPENMDALECLVTLR